MQCQNVYATYHPLRKIDAFVKYRKIRKLFLTPIAFFYDAIKRRKKVRAHLDKKTFFAINIAVWKREYLERCFPQYQFFYISFKDRVARHHNRIQQASNPEFLVWGYNQPSDFDEYAKAKKIMVTRLEDGFLRSAGLGSNHVLPFSLCIDQTGMYFNSRESSDLENLLQTYDFEADNALMKEARECLDLIRQNRVTKYNPPQTFLAPTLYGPKRGRRILVIGQVEDDQSVLLGCDRKISNNHVVNLAAQENPGAQIIFKVHPDVIVANRKELSNPEDVKNLALLIREPMSMDDALTGVDRVYTISSLAGFESLIRGVPVTVLGCPFYAGWGITDTRQSHPRRNRRLSIEEVFAGSYLLYAKYFDTANGQSLSLRDVIVRIVSIQISGFTNKKLIAPVEGLLLNKDNVKPNSTLVKAQSVAGKRAEIPAWYQAHPGVELASALDSDKPLLLYIPWIAEHSSALISKIRSDEYFLFAPLDFVTGIYSNKTRSDVLRFARENPNLYRRMIARRLAPIRNRVAGLVLTFDWAPVMRVIASICEELEIPRVLIPHESVFIDRDKYYWDPTALAAVPATDIVLAWGQLQKDIFVERGYPAERIHIVGAPKFDSYFDYQPLLSREQFCRLFGLDIDKKVVLFASQPLDSQSDAQMARKSQRQAIQDLLDLAETYEYQLIVRLPPSKDDILGDSLRARIQNSNFAVIDDSNCYLVSPEEVIYHSGLITSVNSTMLLEGLLAGRPALSLKYIDFEQIWEQAGITAVQSKDELDVEIRSLLTKGYEPSLEGIAWASFMFGVGKFDGQACFRIRQKLINLIQGGLKMGQRPTALARLFGREPLDVIGIPSSIEVLAGEQRFVPKMLKARTIVSSAGLKGNLKALASVEIFFQWGITPNIAKAKQHEIAKSLSRPIVIIEDGFIRSINIGLSGEPCLSIIIDDTTAYYDSTRPSRLQRLLEIGPDLTTLQFQRSKAAINKIIKARVSKYNHAPDFLLKLGSPSRRKVLLVDQRFGDQSVASGLADEHTFERMLFDVIRDRADYDIIIKQHPDAIKGGKSSYFSDERLAFTRYMDNIFLLNFDINPFALFDIVDEVFVVTSGMGFEALMAGKTVHCYGVPFYSGWGITLDKISSSHRTRHRSLEELFYFAYIESSRYFHPEKNCVVEVEELIDYIETKRSA